MMTTRSKAALALLCACLLTFITGSSYVFAIFRQPAIDQFGVGGAMGAYAVTNALAPIPMLIGGFFIDRGKAVWTAAIGAFFAALGWGLAGSATTPGMFIFTYGFVGGIGMGLILTSALSNTLRYFPGKRGLIAGLISCINGAAGMVMAPVAQHLIEGQGLGSTLHTFATIYCVIGLFVAVFYKAAPVEGVENVDTTQKTARKPFITLHSFIVLRSLDFWILFILFTCGAFSGLMIVANATGIGTMMYHVSPLQAAYYVSLYSVAGTLGRFAFGWLSDHLGKTRSLQLTFFTDFCGLLILTLLPPNPWALGVGLFTVGITYGGTIAIMPAFVMDRFGPANQGVNYALVFCGFSVAAMIAPKLGADIGLANDGNFSNAFYIAMGAAALGFLCATLLGARSAQKKSTMTGT